MLLREEYVMSKKSKYVILIILILCAGVISYNSYKNMPKDVAGTYCSGDEKSGNAKYIALDKDGGYVIYEQFNFIEKGSYKKEYENMFSLKAETEGEATQWIIYNERDLIHYINSPDSPSLFVRISDIPTYINLQDFDLK